MSIFETLSAFMSGFFDSKEITTTYLTMIYFIQVLLMAFALISLFFSIVLQDRPRFDGDENRQRLQAMLKKKHSKLVIMATVMAFISLLLSIGTYHQPDIKLSMTETAAKLQVKSPDNILPVGADRIYHLDSVSLNFEASDKISVYVRAVGEKSYIKDGVNVHATARARLLEGQLYLSEVQIYKMRDDEDQDIKDPMLEQALRQSMEGVTLGPLDMAGLPKNMELSRIQFHEDYADVFIDRNDKIGPKIGLLFLSLLCLFGGSSVLAQAVRQKRSLF